MKVCQCNKGLSNTGTPKCQPLASVSKRQFLVPLVADDNTFNEIDCATDTIDQAFIDGKINETDPSKRWYPLPCHENVTPARAESIFQSFDSGRRRKLRDGIRNFSSLYLDQGSQYKDKLDSVPCVKVGIFDIDINGSITGDRRTEGKLRPIPMEEKTFDAQLVFPDNSNSAAVAVSYDWSDTITDADLGIIRADEITADLIGANGLLDVNGEEVSTGQTSLVIDLTLDFGSVCDPEPVKGLVDTDFELFNETDTAVVAILTSTEDPSGRYTITYAFQDVSDVLELRITAVGYDDTKLKAVQLVVV